MAAYTDFLCPQYNKLTQTSHVSYTYAMVIFMPPFAHTNCP